jgi:hypothetical protein
MARPATKKPPKKKKTTRARAKKAKDTEAKPAQPQAGPPNPVTGAEAIDEIAARAEGGKVAVINRGDKKAKVVKGAQAPDAPEPIVLSDDAKETVNDVLQRANNIDIQLGQNRARFMVSEKELLDQRENSQREVESTIKMMGRRFNVPDGWVLNLEDMTFVPRPSPRGMPGPFPRR